MLTPIDIQNHRLKSTMGGYNKKETDDFLAEILDSFEVLYKENQDLKDKITSLSEGVQYYKQMEATLQKALVLAEKTSTETQEAAKTQADSLLRESKTQADSLVREATAEAEILKSKANQELEETRNHVRKLVQSYENYRLQFKKLAASQIEMLDSEAFSIYAPELDELIGNAPSADYAMGASSGIQPINNAQPKAESVPPVSAPKPEKPPVIEFISPDDDLPPQPAGKPEQQTASAFVDVGADVSAGTAKETVTDISSAFISPEPQASESRETPSADTQYESPFVDFSADTQQSPFVDLPSENPAEKPSESPAETANSAQDSPFIFIDPE